MTNIVPGISEKKYSIYKQIITILWCDLGKSVWSQTCDIFSFLFDWSAHLDRYILLKNPPESDQWFQSYEHLKDSVNNKKKKEKKEISFSDYIVQSKLPTSDVTPLDRNTYELF